MKINKEEFEKHVAYAKIINSVKVSDLDLSEFDLPNKEDYEYALKNWEFTGLNTYLFISSFLL